MENKESESALESWALPWLSSLNPARKSTIITRYRKYSSERYILTQRCQNWLCMNFRADIHEFRFQNPNANPLKANLDDFQPENVINHPSHYGGADNPYEAIKVIEAWGLGFHLGNTVKYISRAGKKDADKTIEDLEKAKWYLDRRIEQLKKNKE